MMHALLCLCFTSVKVGNTTISTNQAEEVFSSELLRFTELSNAKARQAIHTSKAGQRQDHGVWRWVLGELLNPRSGSQSMSRPDTSETR